MLSGVVALGWVCVCVGRGGGGVGGAHSTSPICREIRTHTGYL